MEEERRKSTEKKETIETTADPAEANITVLNGGATPGSARKIKAFLVGEGYDKAEAGNIESGSYEGVFVYYKESFKKAAEDLAKILEEKYPNISVKESSSEEEQQSDLVVILGK